MNELKEGAKAGCNVMIKFLIKSSIYLIKCLILLVKAHFSPDLNEVPFPRFYSMIFQLELAIFYRDSISVDI